MKIANYQMQQNSMYHAQSLKSTEETLTVRKNGTVNTLPLRKNAEDFPEDKQPALLQLSGNALKPESSGFSPAVTSKEDGPKDQQMEHPLLRLLEDMIFFLTGKRIRLQSPDPDLDLDRDGGQTPSLTASNFGLSYDYHEVTVESESVRYEAAGFVTTADGKRFSFTVQMSMNRTFYQEISFQLRVGNAVDPLVVSLDGAAPELSQKRYAFDLDSDGQTENIPFASGGSGFLALDKNGDGQINNGSELFGPGTGNGFMELALYDLDKNGWIDEEDGVFSKLSVLMMSGEGERTLISLGEAGIGAIYLKAMETPFSLKDHTGEYGKLRSTSVYLRENGSAGTIHHLDLTL